MRAFALMLSRPFVTACSGRDLATIPPPQHVAADARTTTPSGITIAAIRTGWVGVKEPHWRYVPPAFLVVPRIFLSRRWHEWIPNVAYVVAVGGRTLLVDTGADPRINDPAYMACDRSARAFYSRNMRFIADTDQAIERRLPALGFPLASVETVVITHFHGDHPGRLEAFPEATVLTGPGNWPTHVGAVPCTLPKGFVPQLAAFEDGPFGVFAQSQRLLGRDQERYWLIAGDATFSRAETDALHVCGVSEDVAAARATQESIQTQLQTHDTVLLPAHDPAVFARLADGPA